MQAMEEGPELTGEQEEAGLPNAPQMEDFTEDLLDALAAEEVAPGTEPDALLTSEDALTTSVEEEGEEEPAEPSGRSKQLALVEAARLKYRLHESDTGSSQVQIAILTARIGYMTKHMQENKKDYASLRGLTAMVNRRRKVLMYLLSKDRDEFMRLTTELGIRTRKLLRPKLSGARGRRIND